MRQILTFIAIGLYLSSCSCSNNGVQSSFIDLNRQDKVSVFDIFESVDLVFLETNEQSLIAVINKVIYFSEKYYIFDERQQILFCFDSAGNFLFKISQQGQGPEEYLRLEDFNIDPYNNQLLLLEPYGNLLVFDLSGQFISKTRLPDEIPAYNEVFVMDKNRLVFISLSYFELVFYDRDKNVILDRRYRTEQIAPPFLPIYRTYIYGNDLFFSLSPSNEIINLSDSTVFSWNFGKQTNTKETIENLKKFVLTSKIDFFYENYDWIGEKKLKNIPYLNFESSRYRFYALETKYNFMKYIFYDKKTEKSFVFDKTKEGICFAMLDFNGETIIMCDRGFRQTGNSDIDKNLVYYHSYIFTEEQKRMYHFHKTDDNPFLVKYNFKK
jgi:hypothetical protein